MIQTVAEVLNRLPRPSVPRLPAPAYTGPADDPRPRVGLAVESMRRHVTAEGWVLFEGLEKAGWTLYGHGLPRPQTDVRVILEMERPSCLLMQDVREWDVPRTNFRDGNARFYHVGAMRGQDDCFRGTVIKDAHQRPAYHRDSAAEIGAHFWVTPYHPDIVCHLAPYVRKEHLIRSYHSVEPADVPPYSKERRGCLLSGAVGAAYPLRKRLLDGLRQLPETEWLPHPGYNCTGCQTPAYLQTLSHFKVAICTSAAYAFSLRKLVEATAAGCVVVTDLPADDPLPWIDANLVRVHPGFSAAQIGRLLRRLYDEYEPERQEHFSRLACEWYDWRAAGLRLAADVERLRRSYRP